MTRKRSCSEEEEEAENGHEWKEERLFLARRKKKAFRLGSETKHLTASWPLCERWWKDEVTIRSLVATQYDRPGRERERERERKERTFEINFWSGRFKMFLRWWRKTCPVLSEICLHRSKSTSQPYHVTLSTNTCLHIGKIDSFVHWTQSIVFAFDQSRQWHASAHVRSDWLIDVQTRLGRACRYSSSVRNGLTRSNLVCLIELTPLRMRKSQNKQCAFNRPHRRNAVLYSID